MEFAFWLNGLLIMAQGSLQLLFAGRFTGKTIRATHLVGYLAILCGIELTARWLDWFWLADVLELAALYGINRKALENDKLSSAVTALLAGYVTELSFGLVNPLEYLLFPQFVGGTMLTWLVILASVLALLLCCGCYGLILQRLSLQEERREPYIGMLLPPGLFFWLMERYILWSTYGQVLTVPYPVEIGRQMALLVLQALGMGALLCALYAYKRTCDGFRAQVALASLTQQAHAQQAYMTQAQLRYEQTRAFRHDIKNHLTVLEGLLKKGEIRQGQDYLQKLEAVAGELSFPAHTGNLVVDILLGDKLELAQSQGIQAEIALTLPNPCGVDDLDWCIVFANALDNAIHACLPIEGEKMLTITGERQGDFYMLEFDNTCLDEPLEPIGIGLTNVQAVAKKYDGAMIVEKSPVRFRLNVLLNISRRPDDNSRQIP